MTIEVKICGLKTEEAVAAALESGATHIGFIFFEKSPRNIDPEQAGRLRELARGRADVVAVSVDADDDSLDRIVAQVRPDILQLHGKESPERVAELKHRYGLPVMKVVFLRERDDLDTIRPPHEPAVHRTRSIVGVRVHHGERSVVDAEHRADRVDAEHLVEEVDHDGVEVGSCSPAEDHLCPGRGLSPPVGAPGRQGVV